MQTLVIVTVPIPEAPEDAMFGPHLNVNVPPLGEVNAKLIVLYAVGVANTGRFALRTSWVMLVVPVLPTE